ncbi:3-oxoacyl-reductase [Mytilinidion resinicola]|uniref:3-oxoacyl-reductase n=1 Tax=Mytilinidion resinicola TaxID=574789 RepID=A0A6A6YKA9_9PEZI|nr:3-oxoacyl-reductase [Mytilinidion resinicola]KAF2808979.1 3-oxoacyl-reductase [Mytilinidion resinicola]
MSHLEAGSLFNVKDMLFVVTGGGTGIGAMFSRALDINGAAKVYIIGRRLEKLQEVAQSATNNNIIPIQGDITSKDSLASIVERITSEVGFVNAVIANSGAAGPRLDALPKSPPPSLAELHNFFWATPPTDFNETFFVNTTAAFYTLLAFLPLLDASNKDAVISGFSRRPGMGYAYAASKAAVIHLVKQMSTCLADYHIRCNSFCPGIYPSDMSQGMMGKDDRTAMGSVSGDVVPLTRIGTDEDAAGALLFLCSRAGAYINGNILISDGGRMSIVPATY